MYLRFFNNKKKFSFSSFLKEITWISKYRGDDQSSSGEGSWERSWSCEKSRGQPSPSWDTRKSGKHRSWWFSARDAGLDSDCAGNPAVATCFPALPWPLAPGAPASTRRASPAASWRRGAECGAQEVQAGGMFPSISQMTSQNRNRNRCYPSCFSISLLVREVMRPNSLHLSRQELPPFCYSQLPSIPWAVRVSFKA